MNQITFIGLGWLSKAAAAHFQKLNYQVKATKRTLEQVENIEVYAWSLGEVLPKEALSENIVISIASRSHELQHYEHLFKQIESFKPTNIILISTTSVYGNNRGVLDENLDLSTESANNIHLQISNLFQQYFPNGVVLRLAGLVGPGRNPAKFLAGKVDVADPELSVNLVHQKDVVRAIECCIMNNAKGVYNISSSTHPSRQEFYTQLTKHYSLEIPKFVDANSNNAIRIVSNLTFKQKFKFEFEVDDVMSYYLSSDIKE